MPDGSACKPPVGSPVTNTTVPSVSGGAPVATGSVPTGGANPTTGAGSSSTTLPSAAKPNAGARVASTYEFVGAAAALAMAVVATL